MCERVTQLTRLFWQSCKPAARQAKQVPHLRLRLYFPRETPEVLYQKFNLRVFLVFCCVSVGGCRYLQGSLNCSFSMFYQTSLGTRDIPRNMLFHVKENFFLSIPAGYYYNIKIVIFIEKQRSIEGRAVLHPLFKATKSVWRTSPLLFPFTRLKNKYNFLSASGLVLFLVT